MSDKRKDPDDFLRNKRFLIEFLDLVPSDVAEPVPHAADPMSRPTDALKPTHAPNFETITWNGVRYCLTPKQRDIVAILWKAWQDGEPFISGAYLLERSESETKKLSKIFGQNGCWKTLVSPGELFGGPIGTYCLTPLAA